jgi:hypothetical protein
MPFLPSSREGKKSKSLTAGSRGAYLSQLMLASASAIPAVDASEVSAAAMDCGAATRDGAGYQQAESGGAIGRLPSPRPLRPSLAALRWMPMGANMRAWGGGGEELAVGGRGRMFVSGWAEESSHDQRSAHFPVIR